MNSSVVLRQRKANTTAKRITWK